MTTEAKPMTALVVASTIMTRQMQEVLRKSLPPNVSQERFTQAAVAALKHNPVIFQDCDHASIYNSIVEAARDGLMPDGRHGALVPFNTKNGKRCQFLIMPEGIIDKLAALGVTCYAVSVYSGDKIRIWNDDHGQHVDHEPQAFGDRGERIGAYASARIRATGVTYVEAMNMEDLDKARRASRSKDKNGNPVGPWMDWPDRMEQKTALHRLCKRLPNVAMPEDEEFREDERGPITVEATAPPVPANGSRPAALQRVVDSMAAAQQEEPPPHSDGEVPPQ